MRSSLAVAPVQRLLCTVELKTFDKFAARPESGFFVESLCLGNLFILPRKSFFAPIGSLAIDGQMIRLGIIAHKWQEVFVAVKPAWRSVEQFGIETAQDSRTRNDTDFLI